ncbi:MAG: diguanylate cyclase [Methylococcaceae bacterium]|nr:MAG: diguanylate cyclase [Methylococcaceae bacterium]
MPRSRHFWMCSIRCKLICGVALVHAVLMTLFIWDLGERQREFLMEQSLDQAGSLAGTLAANSVSWLLANDVSGLDEVIRSQFRHPHLRYAMLLSPQGRVLGHSDLNLTGRYVNDPVSLRLIQAAPALQTLVFDRRLVDVAVPVFTGDNKLIAWARVALDQRHVDAGLLAVAQKGRVYAAVAIGVGVLFAWLMALGITRGLHGLTKVAARVSEGHHDERVQWRRDDELGVLADGFNAMLDSLRAQELARNIAQQQLKLAAKVFENSGEGIFITDAAERIILANHAFGEITGYPPAEVQGRTPRLLDSGRHSAAFFQAFAQQLQTQGCWRGEIWNRRKSGEIYLEWLSASVIRDDAGNIVNYVGIFSDISERKAAGASVEYQAYHDALTGLPNRLLLFDRIRQAMAHAQRSQSLLAVLFIDLDRFKAVNDSYGHQMGDELLIGVAERLRHCVRAEDTVSRLGGDEFVVLLAGIDDAADAQQVAQKVLASMQAPFLLQAHRIGISPSVGISLYPQDGATPEALLDHADQAMYQVKSAGRNDYKFYTA